ncbi:tripartite-type tricarboxylate transporter receptor subunit TctC [Acidovorax soli]|uniref:Tripartite-type tricarboxylate transporter receptor subunit TctC n=1 Tax=Acidovorax soli TaxID=592050 RepID=A0A7X0U720_9BURK|nr:tripartite tricarboxylate transporter substrate binding protein [Acidovorax soli]MBB6557503.1 tripartite-type tricarboxylate transporter receptor subunit TctC [Acidovorax soli]
MTKRIFLISAALALAASATFAQPSGDAIRIIIPLSPGTPSDSVTRVVATAMAEHLKRPVIVDNKPGANGILAVQDLMRSKPDGNTLMLGGISPVALNPAVIKNLPYDPRRDFTPIGGMYNTFQGYMVSNTLPVKDFPEFIAYAKVNPGKVSVAEYSALTKLQFAALGKLADVKLLTVPYKITTTAYTDVMAGTVDATLADIASALNYAKGGKLKVLAINLPERNALAPGLPTASETVPGLAVPVWSGMIGPAGIPQDVVAKLNAALNAALGQKDVVEKIAAGASVVWPTTPEEFSKHIDKEITRWTKLARDAGVQPE